MGRKRAGKWRIQKDQLCLETRKEPGGRLVRGMALRKKRGAEKPGLEYALGGRAAKASLRQMIGPGCFDACKEEFNEEAVARHSACMSCHGNLGINCHRQRNIPKTYGWATPRQVRRRGADV